MKQLVQEAVPILAQESIFPLGPKIGEAKVFLIQYVPKTIGPYHNFNRRICSLCIGGLLESEENSGVNYITIINQIKGKCESCHDQ